MCKFLSIYVPTFGRLLDMPPAGYFDYLFWFANGIDVEGVNHEL